MPRICSRSIWPTISGGSDWTCASTAETISSSVSPETSVPQGQWTTFMAILLDWGALILRRAGKRVHARQLSGDLPQASRRVAVDRMAHHATAAGLDALDDVGNVAGRAVDAAHAVELRRRGSPHCRRGALLGRLELAYGIAVVVEPSGGMHLLAREVALQGGHDPAGVHGERADPLVLAERVELEGEQAVGRLRLAVGLPLLVRIALELQVVEADRADPVSRRGELDHARAAAARERGPEEVREDIVAEVVGRELALPAWSDAELRRRHDAGVVDEQIELAVGLEEELREAVDALDPGELGARMVHPSRGHDNAGSGALQRPHRLEP